MAEALKAEDLRVAYRTKQGEIKAVNGISFSVERGSVFCLVGESGAGKSTTALALIGLLPRSARSVSGHVHFGNIDLLSVDHRVLQEIRGRDIAMVPQDPKSALNPMFTIGAQIEEQIQAHTPMTKRDARRLAAEMVAEMGIPDPDEVLKRLPFQLSGGMCQRVALAMAMALKPQILIADEPTSSLDSTLQIGVLRRLKSYCREHGASIILITHDMGIVAHMADQVAVMYAGIIVEQAEVHAIFGRPHHPYMWGLMQAVPRMDRPGQRFIPISGNPPDMLHLSTECPFLPRCSKAVTRCRIDEVPRLVEVEQDHRVACYNPMDHRYFEDFVEA